MRQSSKYGKKAELKATGLQQESQGPINCFKRFKPNTLVPHRFLALQSKNSRTVKVNAGCKGESMITTKVHIK